MGRAGAGGGGGGHSSSGGHSSGSRSSGGHTVSGGGSSSRPGTGRMGTGGTYGAGPAGGPPPPRRRVRTGFGPVFGMRMPYVRRPRAVLGWLFPLIIVLLMIAGIMFFGSMAGSGSASVPESSVNREELDLGYGFNNDCVTDETGWISDVSKVERNLEYFYDKTGVQPYVYFMAYDPLIESEADRLAFAEYWYDENIPAENGFLWMYFAEEDADNDVGYMCYVNGLRVSSVMDAEAVDIFWAYVDEYWYSSMDTDDMIAAVFDSTADRIMSRTTTAADVAVRVAVVLIIVAAVAGIIIIMRTRRKHKREENEETERILNTPIDKL